MPWRLILFIICVVFFAAFMGANLDNKTQISLLFYTTEPIAVYMIMLYSFVAGVIIMIPFTFRTYKKQKNKTKKTDEEPKKTTSTTTTDNIAIVTDKLKSFFSKKKGSPQKEADSPEKDTQ